MSKNKTLVRPNQKAPVAPAAAPVEKKGVEARAPRFVHDVQTGYSGASPGFNGNKSRTSIPVNEFGSMPDKMLTERQLQVARPLQDKYGVNPFQRGDMDSGVLKEWGRKGLIQYVDGDPSSESARFKFTPEGSMYHENPPKPAKTAKSAPSPAGVEA